MHDTCARLTGERADGCGNDARLFNGIGGHREAAVRQRALEAVECPRGRRLLPQEAALVVEETRAQSHRLPWLEDQFGRCDLQMRRVALPGRRGLVDRETGDGFGLLRSDGVDGVARDEEDAAARDS